MDRPKPKVPLLKSNIFKVTVSWMALVVLGLGSFVLARNDVNGRRREIMMSKKRMADATKQEYESERFIVPKNSDSQTAMTE